MENSSEDIFALIVGKSADSFTDYAARLLGSCEIETALCENIYSAVARLAKNTRQRTIIIGRFTQLNGQNGRFFAMLAEKNAVCCCLDEEHFSGMRKPFMQTAGRSLYVITEPAQLEQIIDWYLQRKPVGLTPTAGAGGDIAHDGPLVTEAELDALLAGGEGDLSP